MHCFDSDFPCPVLVAGDSATKANPDGATSKTRSQPYLILTKVKMKLDHLNAMIGIMSKERVSIAQRVEKSNVARHATLAGWDASSQMLSTLKSKKKSPPSYIHSL